MINALTVDVEDWYHTNGLNISRSQWNNLPSTVYPNTIKLLNIFDEYELKGTFFILGDVAKRYPDLVKEIAARGHEIGGHSMNHQMISKQTIEEFKADFLESMDILETITGNKIRYYRAPSWSISRDKLEVLSFLDQKGIFVDSSLQPIKTPLSGINGIPLKPFKPIIKGKKMELIEFPPSVIRFTKHLAFPFCGGFYLRSLPYSVIKRLLKIVNKDRPGMVYIHPWELDPDMPKHPASILINFIQTYNLKTTEAKLRQLLREFKFAPVGHVIKSQDIEHQNI